MRYEITFTSYKPKDNDYTSEECFFHETVNGDTIGEVLSKFLFAIYKREHEINEDLERRIARIENQVIKPIDDDIPF